MISASRETFGLGEYVSVFILAYPFGSRESYFPELNSAQPDQGQSLKVVWTLFGVVVPVSLLLVGGIVLIRANHGVAPIPSTHTSDTESEVEIPYATLSLLTGFEMFVSEENGLTREIKDHE
jgi:hypothetical protein